MYWRKSKVARKRVGITNASGALIDQRGYDAFGNITSETQPTNGDRFGYAGMHWDAVLCLFLDGARDLNPQDGDFTTIDSSGFRSGTTNLYGYTSNSPTNATDPSGLAALKLKVTEVA